ncbi:MAG: flagellar motor protein MotB, partial [Myxococcota bacterium]
MGKREKSESSGPKVDPNAWMATFSDLVTLLITFFVLLLSMSSLDSKPLKD